MDKRYQVFISSTFVDLVDERQAALKAVLELDHMPAGMELFPASDDGAWDLIKDVIDASDYYVLIIGGRYGSLDEEGIGFTEKEYDYAIATGKPVIPLLHSNPDNLPRDKTETDPAAWERLKAFRDKVEQKHTCVYWSSSEELKSKLIVGLTANVKKHPGVGWVRADQVPSGATLSELLFLKDQVTELQAKLDAGRTGPPPGAEDLYQGDDTFEIELTFQSQDEKYNRTNWTATIKPSWNEIFAAVAPRLINEATEREVRKAMTQYFEDVARGDFQDDDDLKGQTLRAFSFKEHDLDTCMVQLRALGLVEESIRKRSVADTATYWKLTAFGDNSMVRLRALRRTPPPAKQPGGKAHKAEDEDGTV